MKEKVKEQLKNLPNTPGIYFFKKGSKILYIGKATSLRDRVRSYFGRNIEETRGPLISKMLGEFTDIKFQKTDSVLEALILEANLIKKHQPEANTDLKDDKSFNYVVITKEDWPRVLVVRGKELDTNTRMKTNDTNIKYKFGPFTNSSQLKEAMKLVRKIFPYRDKCNPFFPSPDQGESYAKRGVRCFNRQIGLCPGVCTGEISKKYYAKQIRNIVLFFEGKKKFLIKNLEKQMKDFAKNREFEKAAQIKKQIFALGHIQDVVLIKDQILAPTGIFGNSRIEGYDIAHMSGKNMVGVMTVVENGETKKTDYRKFKIREQKNADDTKALSEVLERRLNHPEWPLPNLIVVDGGIAQKNAAEKVLAKHNIKIPVVSVVKDERHRPKQILNSKSQISNSEIQKRESEILLANAEAHRFATGFHKKMRDKII